MCGYQESRERRIRLWLRIFINSSTFLVPSARISVALEISSTAFELILPPSAIFSSACLDWSESLAPSATLSPEVDMGQREGFDEPGSGITSSGRNSPCSVFRGGVLGRRWRGGRLRVQGIHLQGSGDRSAGIERFARPVMLQVIESARPRPESSTSARIGYVRYLCNQSSDHCTV